LNQNGKTTVRMRPPKVLVPGVFAAAALALAAGVGAQTPPHADHPSPAKSPEAAPMADPHQGMKAECDAMMARKQEMQGKLHEMDVALDNRRRSRDGR
jgi:hypothetical protein